MALTKEKVLEGYKKAKILIRDAGTRKLTEDLEVEWNGKKVMFGKGWIVPNLSDNDLAKVSIMEDICCKHFMAKDITYAEIDKITTEVFGDDTTI